MATASICSAYSIGRYRRNLALFEGEKLLSFETPVLLVSALNVREYKSSKFYSLNCKINTNSKEFIDKLGEIDTVAKVTCKTNGYLNLQLDQDTNLNFKTMFFNENSEKIRITPENISEIIIPGKFIKCTVEHNKIWESNGKSGMNYSAVQIKLIDTNKVKRKQTTLDTEMQNALMEDND